MGSETGLDLELTLLDSWTVWTDLDQSGPDWTGWVQVWTGRDWSGLVGTVLVYSIQ